MNTDTKCDANHSVLSNPASPRSSLGGETPALSNPASPTSSWGGETPLIELSAKINHFAGKDWGNTTDVHTILWPSIAEVRKQVALSSEEVDILEGWEFQSEFVFAENSHLNGQQLFTKLSWEESFALSILFAYYR
jgi:hypothetical protein